ncbi:Protein of unknown function, partial [Gryllus bimaculatus]
MDIFEDGERLASQDDLSLVDETAGRNDETWDEMTVRKVAEAREERTGGMDENAAALAAPAEDDETTVTGVTTGKGTLRLLRFDSRSPVVLSVLSLELPEITNDDLSEHVGIMDELWECHMSFRGIFFLQDALGKYVGLFRAHPKRSIAWYIMVDGSVIKKAIEELNLFSRNLDAHILPIFRPSSYNDETFFFSDGRKIKSLQQEIITTLKEKLLFTLRDIPALQKLDAEAGRLYSLVAKPQRFPEIDTLEQLADSSMPVVSYGDMVNYVFVKEAENADNGLSPAKLQTHQRIIQQGIRLVAYDEFRKMVIERENVAFLVDGYMWTTSSSEILFGRKMHNLKDYLSKIGTCLLIT